MLAAVVSAASGSASEIPSLITAYCRDPEPRVRAASLQALVSLPSQVSTLSTFLSNQTYIQFTKGF